MARASSSKIDAGTPNAELLPTTGPGTGKTGVSWRTKPGGLDELYLMNEDKTRPLEEIRREAGSNAAKGLMYNPRLGGYQNRSIYNQTTGWQQTQAQQPQQPAMTPQQQEWARMAAERQGAGTRAMGGMDQSMQGIGASAFGPSAASMARPSYTFNPYLGTRAQNIANAKAAGQFDKVRADYNKKFQSTGLVMDEEGNISRSPEAYSKIKQEERDLMRGMIREPQTLSESEKKSGVISKTAIPNRYGRGSTTTSTASKRPPAMVRDEFGRMVPMSPYLKEKAKVQKSKGMA